MFNCGASNLKNRVYLCVCVDSLEPQIAAPSKFFEVVDFGFFEKRNFPFDRKLFQNHLISLLLCFFSAANKVVAREVETGVVASEGNSTL